MHNLSKSYQVAIVGGGPVGLYLGLCLQQAGISYIILEKRSEPRPGSRSLGIHPVSLELFDELGIADSFIRSGIKIQRGHAFTNNRKLGTLSFENCPDPFNYILAHPQNRTELLLEQHLTEQNPNSLIRNAKVTEISESDKKVEITFTYNGTTQRLETAYLVGCDGKNSFVRNYAGISFRGQWYPDTYIMGDFQDNTQLGTDAAIYLCKEGLIESFPLPDGRRRWVVKTSNYIDDVSVEQLTSRVFHRIGYSIKHTQSANVSSFGVQKLIAQPMVKHRIILAGDAAHVVSPIGGQGMNLGWLNARDLADTLKQILTNSFYVQAVLNQYQKRREHAINNAIHRAEMNMILGRQRQNLFWRNQLVSLMLKKPISTLMAKIFTMRGIERWPF